MKPGRFIKSCRIGLRLGYSPNGRPDQKLGPVCVGPCPDGRTCEIVVVGETTFDGIHIEILKCRCEKAARGRRRV
jgi:hypothetical protein